MKKLLVCGACLFTKKRPRGTNRFRIVEAYQLEGELRTWRPRPQGAPTLRGIRWIANTLQDPDWVPDSSLDD